MFCEKCGTEIAASVRFCEYCGSPIAATLDKLSQAPAVQESSNPPGISPRFEGQAKSYQAPAVQESASLGEAPCSYCTKLIPAGALNCPSCGRERYLSQTPAAQKAASLNEAQCYYCTKAIPAGAINCPSCGKERKELHDLRLAARNALIVGVSFSFLFTVMSLKAAGDRWSTWFGDIDTVKMFHDPVFWWLSLLLVALLLIIRFVVWRYQWRYAELSDGKKMADWLVRDMKV